MSHTLIRKTKQYPQRTEQSNNHTNTVYPPTHPTMCCCCGGRLHSRPPSPTQHATVSALERSRQRSHRSISIQNHPETVNKPIELPEARQPLGFSPVRATQTRPSELQAKPATGTGKATEQSPPTPDSTVAGPSSLRELDEVTVASTSRRGSAVPPAYEEVFGGQRGRVMGDGRG